MSDGLIGLIGQDVPDLTEAIVAFRSWDVRAGRLIGPYKKREWDTENTAQCVKDTWGGADHPKGQPVPDEDCDCGLYGYFESKVGRSPYSGFIRGAIACEGRMTVHETGLRVERAKIICLVEEERAHDGFPVEERNSGLTRLAKWYGVPLVQADELEAFAYEFGGRIPEQILAPIRELNEEARRKQEAEAKEWRARAAERAKQRKKNKAPINTPGLLAAIARGFGGIKP